MRDLAAEAKVSASTISRFENGSPDVYLSHVRALFEALGMQFYASDSAAAHFVIVARRIDSSRWVRVGTASTDADGVIRATVPLLDRTLFLRPVGSAQEAEAWPYEVDRETVFPTRERA